MFLSRTGNDTWRIVCWKQGVDVSGTFDVGVQSRRASRDGWNSALLRFRRENRPFVIPGRREINRNAAVNPRWESKRFHRRIRFHRVIINIHHRSIQISFPPPRRNASLRLSRWSIPFRFKSEKRRWQHDWFRSEFTCYGFGQFINLDIFLEYFETRLDWFQIFSCY